MDLPWSAVTPVVATVVAAAAAPFAPTAYARARLLRQLCATGLLPDCEIGESMAVRGHAAVGGAPGSDH